MGGEFRIDRLIGRGGVGLVYLARQFDPPRDVVVKVLAPHWQQDGEALARFDREAKRLAGLHHPNIVEMFDHGHDKGRSFLVMEYLEGELLSDYVARKRRLTLEEFVPIAAQILKGIGHVHSRELMVRDVKPANIMLCERKGRANFVKILDFGLAKLLRGDTAITDEHVMGTVGYLAPEAIKGEPVDLRVDVYAIGVLFFYMLSGRLPFDDDTNAPVFYKTVHEPPPDLRVLLGDGHGVPEGVIELIESCLAKDPAGRPFDADHIVEQLIDVVPASMFRLPRGPNHRSSSTRLEPTAGNTGMIELIRGKGEPALAPGKATPIPGSIPALDVAMPALSDETGPSTPVVVDEPPPRAPMRLVALSVAVGALLAIVVIGAFVLAGGDDDEPTAVSQSTASPAPASDLTVELDAIEARIDAGELDAATDLLDRLRGAVGEQPRFRARIDRLDKRVLVERLVATAIKFEEAGDTAAALSAYRDALEADPTHEGSRRALARLTAVPDPIDIVEVPEEEEIASPAHGKPSDRRNRRPRDAGTKAPAAGSDPGSKSPASDPDPPKDKPDRKREDTFLPTKKPGDGNDVFLPTAKTP